MRMISIFSFNLLQEMLNQSFTGCLRFDAEGAVDEPLCLVFIPQSTLKKKSIRSMSGKAEKRLSQQIEV